MHCAISSILPVLVATQLICFGNVSAGQIAHAGIFSGAALSERGYTGLPMKKGGSGVALGYQVQGTPEIGKPLMIKILMHSSADAKIVVHVDTGLQLKTFEPVMQSTAGISAEHEIAVVPMAQGRFYVHVMATSHGRTSASAIAVQIGADKNTLQAKPSAMIKIMPNGERINSMPAQ